MIMANKRRLAHQQRESILGSGCIPHIIILGGHSTICAALFKWPRIWLEEADPPASIQMGSPGVKVRIETVQYTSFGLSDFPKPRLVVVGAVALSRGNLVDGMF